MKPHSIFKAILSLKNAIGISTTSPTPNFYPLLQRYRFPFSLNFCTTTSGPDPNSFAVSYLINNLGFSLESALKTSKHTRFKTSHKPDSVVTFFRNYGFSDSDLYHIIRREPWLLSCNAQQSVLPKFEFLTSKGASTTDIVQMVNKNPRFLRSSLENHIIPTYALLNGFLQSDKSTCGAVVYCSSLLSDGSVPHNIKLLTDNGVANFNIARVLRCRPSLMYSSRWSKMDQELKNLGFDPSKSYFGIALLAKGAVSKFQWSAKMDTFKKWGWSEDAILEAFRRQPLVMQCSRDKINRVMRFWVDQLGWDSSHLVKGPGIFGYSLEKRIVPRASVVRHLLSRGLRSESASFLTPFVISEKMFLQKFVKCFQKEETSQLLKLYHERMNLDNRRATGCI